MPRRAPEWIPSESESRPLWAVPRTTGGGAVEYLVQLPDERRYCSIGEREYEILQMLRAGESAAAIAGRLREGKNLLVTEGAIAKFASSLERLGLIQGGSSEVAPTQTMGERSRIGRRGLDIFLIRIPLFNPDRIAGAIARRARFLFQAWFVFAGIAVIGAGIGIMLSEREVWAHAFSWPWRWSAIGTTAVLFLGTCFVHEFAHAVALKRFGGTVPEMGLVLICLLPGFYCDVTSTYGLNARRQRIWVTVAGPFAHLFVAGLLVIAWRVLGPEWIRFRVLPATVLFVATTVAFNAVPLARLDGYFLLTELVGIPNLQTRAFRLLREAVRRRGPSVSRTRRPPGRRELFVGLYGVLVLVAMAGLTVMSVAALLVGLRARNLWSLAVLGLLVIGLFRFLSSRGLSRTVDSREKVLGSEAKEIIGGGTAP